MAQAGNVAENGRKRGETVAPIGRIRGDEGTTSIIGGDETRLRTEAERDAGSVYGEREQSGQRD